MRIGSIKEYMCKDCKYFEFSGVYVDEGMCRKSGYKMKNEIPLFYAGAEELKNKGEQIPAFFCKYHKKEPIKKRKFPVHSEIIVWGGDGNGNKTKTEREKDSEE